MNSQLKTIVWCAFFALWLVPLSASAGRLSIEAPQPQSFVQDLADLVTPDDEVLIDEWCQALQTEHTVPVLVVTIESMAQHGGEGLLVETFARSLFEQWGNDPAFALAEDWRRGILLLISKNDRKARIELGGTWPPDYIARCIRIMDGVIVPQFKAGDYSGGTVAGVQAIADMVRGDSAISSESSPEAAPALTEAVDIAAKAPPLRTVESIPPIRQTPVHQVSYPSHRVRYEDPSFGMPPAFGLMLLAFVGIFVLSLIGGALSGTSSSGGGFQNYGSRHHHHHHGGIGSGFHHGGHHFGGHSHGGGFSGGSSHGGGGGRSGGGGSHGGGGGATGSW